MELPFSNLGNCLRLPVLGDAEALVAMRDDGSAGERLTASALDRRINTVANRLQARGMQPADRVLLLGYNSLNLLLAYLAVMRLGAVAVPLNPGLPDDTRNHVVQDAACEWVFSADERIAAPSSFQHLSLNDESLFSEDPSLGEFDCFAPGDDDIAEVLYTSGSTGMPKGVPLTHRGQCWALTYYLQDLEADHTRSRIAVATPLYHMNGFFLTTMALSNRKLIHLMPRFRAHTWLDVIASEKIDYVTGVPTMFALAAQLKHRPAPGAMAHVTDAFLGSSPVSEALVDQVRDLFPNAGIRNSYGTTESGPIAFGNHPQGIERPPTSVGYPVDGVEWRFGNGSTTEGPLELRTPAVSPGYLNRDDATRKVFKDGWYRTFDIMRRDENGFFYFVGRADDMFVCGGENVYPGQVESLLEKHPAVAQAAVIPMDHAIKGQAPAAFVVLHAACEANEDDIKQFALEEGPAFAHPRRVVLLDEMPLGGTRKVDKRALAEVLTKQEAVATQSAEAPIE